MDKVPCGHGVRWLRNMGKTSAGYRIGGGDVVGPQQGREVVSVRC